MSKVGAKKVILFRKVTHKSSFARKINSVKWPWIQRRPNWTAYVVNGSMRNTNRQLTSTNC